MKFPKEWKKFRISLQYFSFLSWTDKTSTFAFIKFKIKYNSIIHINILLHGNLLLILSYFHTKTLTSNLFISKNKRVIS